MFGLGKQKLDVRTPFAGEVVTVDQVPDPVFAQRMLGDGFAVRPAPEATTVEVCAPIAGKLLKVFSTLHAFALVGERGTEMLVHIGLETVELGGKGFEALAATGDEVEAGQPIIRVDLAVLREQGCELITPVVFTKAGQVSSVKVAAGDVSEVGQRVCIATLA